MLSKEAARALVEADLRKKEQSHSTGPLVVLDDRTIEHEWGWVFFWSTRPFAETRDPSQSLFGNAPYLVNRETGELGPSGTARPTEVYVRKYERQLRWRKILTFLRGGRQRAG